MLTFHAIPCIHKISVFITNEDQNGYTYKQVTYTHKYAYTNIKIKTDEANGYTSMQLGVGEAKPNRVKVRVLSTD
jgi:hypothetical protein